jgi:DNA-binding transcriptional ArsR family regulator
MAQPRYSKPEHRIRIEILGLVEEKPGLTFATLIGDLRRLAGSAELGRRSVEWHLQSLEKAGRLVSVRGGGARHFYPPHGPWLKDLPGCAFVQAPKRWPIALVLVHEPGLTVSQIRQRIDFAMNAWQLRHLLRGLVSHGLLHPQRRGRTVVHEPTTRLRGIVAAFTTGSRRSLPLNHPPPPGADPDGSPRSASLSPLNLGEAAFGPTTNEHIAIMAEALS